MPLLPLENPQPDFDRFRRMLLGEVPCDRVYVAELKLDDEIMQWVSERVLETAWVRYEDDPAGHMRCRVDLFWRLGYDFLRGRNPWCFTGLPDFAVRRTEDTAGLSRGTRTWVEEGAGLVRSWEDFRGVDWEGIRPNLAPLDLLAAALRPGMKVLLGGSLFEMGLEYVFGYEGLFLLSHDQPDLVAAFYEVWGAKMEEYYAATIARPEVGGIFLGDDLGFKTGTLMPPAWLREHVLPWYRRFAALAHAHGKLFLLHSCGNLGEIMEELIDEVGIDGYHSFQDVIMPIGEFQRRWGERVAVLGGVDVDRLARLPEAELRAYVRGILAECQPRGRFALGSGNSVTNYVRPENYLAMLEEGLAWGG